MADNRIYMKCSVCGKKLFLGKSFYSGAYYANYSPEYGSLEEKLNKFYSDHMHIEDEQNYNLLGTNFYIEHEFDSDEFNQLMRNIYTIMR